MSKEAKKLWARFDNFYKLNDFEKAELIADTMVFLEDVK